ncbi:hypothetical protein AMR41_07390 [Hapalosiphon sp. MRB220]|nr:hypothetical protein AMR41_07390 [Hapalosiphon sp. MRB220]
MEDVTIFLSFVLFPTNQQLADIAATIYEQGGVVGAVGQSLAGLVNIKPRNGEIAVLKMEIRDRGPGIRDLRLGKNILQFL